MDLRSGLRTIIAALVGIGIVVLIVVLLFKAIFGGGPTKPTIDVGKYADTAATATLLIDGPTDIDQDHRQVKITVSQTQNEIDIIQGYQGNVLQTRTYNNNAAAFGVFLQSLKLMNFSKGNSDPTQTDYRGYCPGGDRYVYTFNDGNKDLFTYWSTSCGQGTFQGAKGSVITLFERQIPEQDFNQLTSDVVLD